MAVVPRARDLRVNFRTKKIQSRVFLSPDFLMKRFRPDKFQSEQHIYHSPFNSSHCA